MVYGLESWVGKPSRPGMDGGGGCNLQIFMAECEVMVRIIDVINLSEI